VAPGYCFTALLEVLRPCFTRPTFDNFSLLVRGWLLARRQTVCGALRAVGDDATKHFSSYHRTLSEAVWEPDEVGLKLAREILTRCPQTVCGVAVDDTTTSHRGPHVYGNGYHRDAVRSTVGRNAWVKGHCWVVVSLLVSVPHCRRKFALPVLARLYLNEKTAAKLHRAHRKKPELAVELVQLLSEHFPDQRFHLLGDTNYGGESVLAHLPANFELTSRLMPQTGLHEPLRERSVGRGRPRKYGPRLPRLEQLARCPARRRAASLYGRRVWVAPVARQVCLHRVPERVVQVVVVKPRRRGGKPQYFYSTVLTLRPEQVLEGYADRWPIETCFEECKQELGLEEPRSRTRGAVERTTPLALWCYSLTVLWFLAGGHEQWQLNPPRWYPQKTSPSFADMLSLLRRQLVREYLNPRVESGGSDIPGSAWWLPEDLAA